MIGRMTRQTKVSLLLTTAIIFVVVAWVDAALVTRPTKTCGNTTYVDEVADGCTTILAAEVDDDINEIITAGVNNIEEANLADDAVSTAKIQDDAITSGKILDGAVAQTKIATSAVNAAKLADGATFIQVIQTQGSLVTPIGTDTSLVSQAITMARTHVRIFVNVYGQATTVTNAGTATYTLKLLRGASTIYTAATFALSGSAAVTNNFPITASFAFIDTTTVGAHTYAVTLTETDGGNTTTSVTARIVLEEIP